MSSLNELGYQFCYKMGGAGAVAYLAPLILKQEPKLKRQVCCAPAQIAKHSVDMAEVVVEAEVFPKILTCLKFPDELVRKHAATVVREVSSTFLPAVRLLCGVYTIILTFSCNSGSSC